MTAMKKHDGGSDALLEIAGADTVNVDKLFTGHYATVLGTFAAAVVSDAVRNPDLSSPREMAAQQLNT